MNKNSRHSPKTKTVAFNATVCLLFPLRRERDSNGEAIAGRPLKINIFSSGNPCLREQSPYHAAERLVRMNKADFCGETIRKQFRNREAAKKRLKVISVVSVEQFAEREVTIIIFVTLWLLAYCVRYAKSRSQVGYKNCDYIGSHICDIGFC